MAGSRWTLRPYCAFLLVLLCFAVYGNVLTGDFIWDDQLQVVRNTNIRTLENVPRAFTSSLWSFMYSKEGGENNRIFDRYYRPLQTVTYILAYQLGGLSPFVYHLINVILHSAATVLVGCGHGPRSRGCRFNSADPPPASSLRSHPTEEFNVTFFYQACASAEPCEPAS